MTRARSLLALVPAALLVAGCSKGSSGSGSGGGSGTAGIAVPREISALPASSASAQSLVRARSLTRTSQALAADSDYELAPTFKFVDERALGQFEILNTIFNAIGQTHYADAENVGAGPYGAVVSWVEQKGDSDQKQLVPWVLDSTMASEDGRDVNRVLVWMRMPMGDGQEHLIKVEMRIYEPPVQRADGSYADYGVWRIDAAFDDSGMAYFAATATHDDAGRSVVAIHDKEGPREVKGIMQRADGEGAGVVTFPDEHACMGPDGGGPDCIPPLVTVAYAYNADHVALQRRSDQGDEPVVYKDRNNPVDIVNRYGLFDATSGADVARSHSFGFPIRYTDGEGRQHWGYYGAWQGRHQIWSDRQQGIDAGTTVTRADRPPNQAAETYTVGDAFRGTLVKRTLVAADIQDLRDIVVETWMNQNHSFRYQGGQWLRCNAPQPGEMQVCDSVFDGNWLPFAYNPSDMRRNVWINYNQPPEPMQCPPQPEPCNPPPPTPPVTLLYCADATACPDMTEPGFYVASTPTNGPPAPTAERWAGPAEDGNLWVNVGGSIYIQYGDSGWVQKKVLSFDQETWTPAFAPESEDIAYSLELNREYYINNPGANYVVKRTGEDAYDVHIELQSVANPVNYASFVPEGAEFRPQWGGSEESTYEFVTDPSSDKFLKLVYKTVGSRDESTAQVGDVLESGQWGLVAYVDGSAIGQFNWDYPREGENWGSQQFLKNADGTYKTLDNPLRFEPVTLVNHAGESKTFSLQFDGSWVNGLPDVHRDLERNDFVVTQEIADKVVVIPAATEVVDAETNVHYLFKPLQVNQYLYVIADPGDVDVSAANGLDPDQVPTYAGQAMGDMPEVPVKYSEGNLVQ